MYLEHFGLGVNPFSLSPKLDFLFTSGTFEESMAHLVYGLDNHEAIVMITGDIGTGKTMALQSFLTNLGPRFEFALITNTCVTALELLKLILEDLGVGVPRAADKSDLLILFKDYLNVASSLGKMVLLVVDEAQNLAPEVLEEVRLLTNLGQGENQPVQIILVGQPELEETVNRPDMAQIRQRIRVHYKLDPLSRPETEAYLIHRMSVAGCTRNVFTSGAIDRIFQGSRGVPRLVNTMAGEALLSAFVAGHEMVQPVDVDEDQDLRFATGPAPAPVTPLPVQNNQQPVAPPAPPQPAAPSPPPVAEPAPPPVPEPAPPPASEPASPPAPESAPKRKAPELLAPPPPAVPVPARRRSQGGNGRARLPWLIGVAVVLAVAALYNFGFLDGLVEAFNSKPDQGTGPTGAREKMVAEQSIPEEQVSQPVETPATAETVAKEVDQEIQQAEIQNKIPEGNPEVSPAETTSQETALPVTLDEETSAPIDSNPVPVTIAPGEDEYFIHIYSFRTLDRAHSFVRHWANPEDSLSIISQEVRNVTWHRVYLGPYVSREAALLAALRLKNEGTINFYKVIAIPHGSGS